MDPKIRKLLATLLAGLSVPGSMGMLGAATVAWRQLRDEFKLFGYQNEEEIDQAISRWEKNR